MGWRSWLGLPEKAEKRAISVPWSVPFNQVPSVSYAAGIDQDLALSLAPVFAAVRIIAQTLSTLPIDAYRRAPDVRLPMPTLPQLFDQLESDGELVPWLHRCLTSLALRGNAFGLIINRDGFGFPTLIEWLNPNVVQPDDRIGKTGWLVNGREVAREDIVHIPWFPVAGQRTGLSPIGVFARTIGLGLQAQSYGANWFDNGGFPPGTFRNTQQTVDQTQADQISARLAAAMAANRPLVYGTDWDYTAISVPPEEAQFVQTMRLNATQIAGIYGLPAEDVGGETGHSMTYQNVEQQGLARATFGLRPWTVILERKFSSLLPERQYVKFNFDALTRADLKTRWEVNQIRVQMGAASIDEIRAQEDMPPLPNGQGATYGPSRPAITANNDGATVTPMRRVQ